MLISSIAATIPSVLWVVNLAAAKTSSSNSSTSSQRSFCTCVPRTLVADWVRISTAEPLASRHLPLRMGPASRVLEAPAEEGREVLVHPPGLLARAAQDADLAMGFEESIEQCRHRRQLGLAAAAIGPDHGIGIADCRWRISVWSTAFTRVGLVFPA